MMVIRGFFEEEKSFSERVLKRVYKITNKIFKGNNVLTVKLKHLIISLFFRGTSNNFNLIYILLYFLPNITK